MVKLHFPKLDLLIGNRTQTESVSPLTFHQNNLFLSDTLIFQSPTCTAIDKDAAEDLAKIAGIDIKKYAADMFAASSDLLNKTAEEIFYTDYKVFTQSEMTFCVGQITSMYREELDKINEKMDYAINVDVPDETIVNRMSGRRACLNCGATYHIVSIPTKVEGICDRCGSPVVLRDDDKPETVQKRLNVYHEQTQPLIEYYNKQGILKTVDGTKDMKAVFSDITAILGA